MTIPLERTVCYLVSFPAHCPYLATSLLSLRRHWQGKVKVFAWRESIDIARRLCGDERIKAEAIQADPSYKGKNSQFLHKIELMQEQSGSNLYLDADTLVNGPLTELFSNAKHFGFAATQFCDWDTSGRLIKGRIRRLLEFPEIDSELIEDVTTNIYPSVNGGVFACMPDSPVLPAWSKWSEVAKSIFICDECVLHLMIPLFEPSGKLVVLPGAFNSSPKYVPMDDASKVRIWHGHGDCWVRPDKSREGWVMWRSAMREALKLNVGKIRSWFRNVRNRYLDELIRQGEFNETDGNQAC